MEVTEAIKSRRSCRSFTREVVPDWKIEKILEAARWAPSPNNSQNWKYILVRDQKLKDAIADLSVKTAGRSWGSGLYETVAARLWQLPARERAGEVEKRYGRTPETSIFGYNAYADVMLIACTQFVPSIMDASPMNTMPLGMAIQNMWLTATSLGLGFAVNTYPLGGNNTEWLKDEIGIPYGWTPRIIIAIGVPDQPEVIAQPRYPLESIIFSERWGRPFKREAFRR